MVFVVRQELYKRQFVPRQQPRKELLISNVFCDFVFSATQETLSSMPTALSTTAVITSSKMTTTPKTKTILPQTTTQTISNFTQQNDTDATTSTIDVVSNEFTNEANTPSEQTNRPLIFGAAGGALVLLCCCGALCCIFLLLRARRNILDNEPSMAAVSHNETEMQSARDVVDSQRSAQSIYGPVTTLNADEIDRPAAVQSIYGAAPSLEGEMPESNASEYGHYETSLPKQNNDLSHYVGVHEVPQQQETSTYDDVDV